MKKIAVVFCVLFSLSVVGSAQTGRRTVTNFDLEKYRNQRIAAEREYRETYAQRGMLSPEELKAASDARIQQTLDLAERMRADQLEQQRLALQAQAQQIQIEELRSQQAAPVYYPYDNSIWGYGGFSDFGGRFRGRHSRFPIGRGYYAAGGNVWPAPLGSQPQRPRPIFRTVSPRGRH
jgi:multidrug efflux pump subunit AcrA (membrane-fusion protein)